PFACFGRHTAVDRTDARNASAKALRGPGDTDAFRINCVFLGVGPRRTTRRNLTGAWLETRHHECSQLIRRISLDMASRKNCSALVDLRSLAPIGERVKRVDRPWQALPLKCGQVGLSRAGRIDPDKPISKQEFVIPH